jgi:ABC-2 type transport system ATP-binding protein
MAIRAVAYFEQMSCCFGFYDENFHEVKEFRQKFCFNFCIGSDIQRHDWVFTPAKENLLDPPSGKGKEVCVRMIQISSLYKFYDQRPVLNDITLSVPEGSILGLLGPNGAGKTTLVSILTGVVKKDRGQVRVNGLDLDRDLAAIRAVGSVVPQAFAFYPTLTVYENLKYFGALYGLKGRTLKTRIDRGIDIGSLQSFLHKKAEACSGGMKRRLNLAIGLLPDPRVLYLDEPTVGVDTQSRIYILEMIKKLNQEQRITMVYTSHYMDEIEQISDEIAIIDEGKIILHDVKEKILIHTGKVFIEIKDMPPSLTERLKALDGVQIRPNHLLVDRDERFYQNMTRLFSIFDEQHVEIRDIVFGYKNLEDLFITLTSGALRD